MATTRTAAVRSLAARLPQLLLGCVAIALMLRTDRFFTARNLQQVVELASIVGILAVGQAFVLIGGGFDLSQGATLGLAAAVAATIVGPMAQAPAWGALAAIATGALVGAINGLFVACVRTNPFVTTLSTTLIVRGLTFAVLGGRQVAGIDEYNGLAARTRIGGFDVSTMSLVFAVCAILGWGLLRFTVIGRHLYAVGGNERAAWLSGLPTARLRIFVFALSGASAGLAAMMMLGFVGVSNATTGSGYELKSIAACVVGGVSLKGGRGSIIGAAAGCLLLQAISSTINLSRVDDAYSTLVTGAVILVFAAADALARRRTSN